jgi:hypothetical protein
MSFLKDNEPSIDENPAERGWSRFDLPRSPYHVGEVEIAGRREAGCQSQGVREPAVVDRSANGPRDYDQAGRRHIGSTQVG